MWTPVSRFIAPVTATRTMSCLGCTGNSTITRKIVCVDATTFPSVCYPHTHFVCVYLLLSREHSTQRTTAAIVDCSNSQAIPRVSAALRDEGLTIADLQCILGTHVHLDHLAGAGHFLAAQAAAATEQHPRCRIVTHPGVKPLLVDPTRLLASARQVYDAEAYKVQVGDPAMIACDPDAIDTTLDGELLPVAADGGVDGEGGCSSGVGPRWIRALHTKGHAKNHVCFFDEVTGTCFTGDSFGVRAPYQFSPSADSPFVNFIIPTTSPIDFNYDEALAAVERIASLPGLKRIAPTHFGFIEGDAEIADATQQLRDLLRVSGELVDSAVNRLRRGESQSDVQAATKHALHKAYRDAALRRAGKRPNSADEQEILAHFSADADINAAGLVVAAARELKSQSKK